MGNYFTTGLRKIFGGGSDDAAAAPPTPGQPPPKPNPNLNPNDVQRGDNIGTVLNKRKSQMDDIMKQMADGGMVKKNKKKQMMQGLRRA